MSEPVLDPALLARVDALLAAYCEALDARDMRGWLACFASDGQYELTTRENVALELPVGLMLDDCPERLRDRVKYVEEVWNHAVEHYQTRHLWTRAACHAGPDGTLETRTHVAVFYTNAEGHSGLLAAGQYRDVIREERGALRLRARRAVLDTAVPPRYLIYPI
jgi:3-phenylpropionate/cinnamic acid dioxygenase small subunit